MCSFILLDLSILNCSKQKQKQKQKHETRNIEENRTG